MGPWEHVRGNEVDPKTGRLLMGRAGFFDEVVRFYDKHLKAKRPGVKDPRFAIQGSDGRWRAQRTWPGRATPSTVSLKKGSYLDSGALPVPHVSVAEQKVQSSGGQMDRQVRSRLLRPQGQRSMAAATESTYLTFSKPVARTTRLTATPRIQLQTAGRGDVMVRLWDVTAATKKAVLVNENVARLQGRETSFDLKSMDWQLAAGHRLAVSIGTIDPSGYWNPKPSGTTVRVQGAFLSLDTQSPRRDVPTQGAESAFLESYIANNTISLTTVPAGSFTVKAPKK